MKLFLDIETLPVAGEQLNLLKSLYDEMIKKRTGESSRPIVDFDAYIRNTSFQGEFGRIFCVGYAKDDQRVECLSGDERKIIKDFWQLAQGADLFIGHNILEFDLRFIYKRSYIHRIKPSRELPFARYRSDPIFDTMKEWEKWGAQGASLHRLSLALGLASPKEKGIDGSQVYDFYLKGKHKEIVEYCKRDVEAVREIYKRITFNS